MNNIHSLGVWFTLLYPPFLSRLDLLKMISILVRSGANFGSVPVVYCGTQRALVNSR